MQPLQPTDEILIAELGYAGFESFVETQEGVTAYIQKKDWNEEILATIQILKSDEFKISFTSEEIEQTNWNAEWEKSFSPIIVDDQCSVRASFHDKPNTQYDIVIEPKMSFGTGHHETTHMMIQHILKHDFEGKSALDMGCGTGVLAIMAEMKGAKPIDAIDIDNWCYINSLENVERNNCKHISVFEGDARLLEGKKYDIIIANINRNILLNDLEKYTTCLNPNGTLLLSGFYESDIPIIEDAAEALGSSINNKKCGTLGDLSVLSFNGNKIITTSAGGTLVTRTKALKERTIYLATQAKDKAEDYTHSEIGYNYRLSNVLAGIGRGQMKVLDQYVNLRRRNYDFYVKHLDYLSSIIFLKEPKNYISNRWLTVILLKTKKERNEISNLLAEHNIETRHSWKPMHLQPIFKDCLNYTNGISEDTHNRGLCLPSGSNLNIKDLERITAIIKTYFS